MSQPEVQRELMKIWKYFGEKGIKKNGPVVPLLLLCSSSVRELKPGDSLEEMVVDVYIGVDPSTL